MDLESLIARVLSVVEKQGAQKRADRNAEMAAQRQAQPQPLVGLDSTAASQDMTKDPRFAQKYAEAEAAWRDQYGNDTSKYFGTGQQYQDYIRNQALQSLASQDISEKRTQQAQADQDKLWSDIQMADNWRDNNQAREDLRSSNPAEYDARRFAAIHFGGPEGEVAKRDTWNRDIAIQSANSKANRGLTQSEQASIYNKAADRANKLLEQQMASNNGRIQIGVDDKGKPRYLDPSQMQDYRDKMIYDEYTKSLGVIGAGGGASAGQAEPNTPRNITAQAPEAPNQTQRQYTAQSQQPSEIQKDIVDIARQNGYKNINTDDIQPLSLPGVTQRPPSLTPGQQYERYGVFNRMYPGTTEPIYQFGSKRDEKFFTNRREFTPVENNDAASQAKKMVPNTTITSHLDPSQMVPINNMVVAHNTPSPFGAPPPMVNVDAAIRKLVTPVQNPQNEASNTIDRSANIKMNPQLPAYPQGGTGAGIPSIESLAQQGSNALSQYGNVVQRQLSGVGDRIVNASRSFTPQQVDQEPIRANVPIFQSRPKPKIDILSAIETLLGKDKPTNLDRVDSYRYFNRSSR